MRNPRLLVAVLAVLSVALGSTLAAPPRTARATPVAADPASYGACARVFPDPQAFAPAPQQAPRQSPFAEGNAVCRALDFIQYDEALAGIEFLSTVDPADHPGLYPDGGRPFGEFVELQQLDEEYAESLDIEGGIEGFSAGLPRTGGTRDRTALQLIKVTDSRSAVPEAERDHFVFSLSIHGIERAGVEGGIRAVEDLVTWAATEPERPLSELDPSRSVSAGEALANAVVYFMLPNPDGWKRGDTTQENLFYQRYNGNGIDLNRDWPSQGFTFRPYTPLSEPESRSYANALLAIKERTAAGAFTGGNDLHGQLIDRAFSFTLIGGAKRPFDKNERAVDIMQRIWADQESRLSWSATIKPNSDPPACVEPGLGGGTNEDGDCDPTPRLYADQFGTIWDTIAYTVTGDLGSWVDSPLGLDGLGLDNEMSLSHLINCGVGKCFVPEAEQLHIDGNKGLIYAQMNLQLQESDPVFRQPGRVAYVRNPERVRNEGSPPPTGEDPPALPPQDDIQGTITGPAESTFEFDVLGSDAGVFNGGLTVTTTYQNVQGVQNGLTQVIVERQNPREGTEGEGDYEPVNAAFSPGLGYAQAGATVSVNAPLPGRYRVRIDDGVTGSAPPGPNELQIAFTEEQSWPDPGQLPYDVANTDFYDELDDHTLEGYGLTPIEAADVASGAVDLSQFDSLLLSDVVAPGLAAESPERASYRDALGAFVAAGGNLVLTDGGMQALGEVPGPDGAPLLPAEAIREARVYAGNSSFVDDEGETYARFDLAKEINRPGSAEGPDSRRQLAEPVPTGFAIQDPDDRDMNSHPNWVIEPTAFAEAGGIAVGRTTGEQVAITGDEVEVDENGDPVEVSGVSLGELAVGDGVVRVIGSLLPQPTQEFDHPFGLAAYGVTFGGYQVLDNALQWVRPGGTWRLAGNDRFETSAEVAYRHWNTVDAVVIASGETFADALVATSLARALDAPILLSGSDQLPDPVFDYLLTRNPSPPTAYVIGGEEALSAQVVEDLKRVYIPEDGIIRLAGDTRAATAVRVAEEVEAVTGVAATTAVVATEGIFADALAVGPVAGNLGPDASPVPLLLVGEEVAPETAAFLEGVESTVIAGGPAAVSSEVEGQLPGPRRIGGVDRFETAQLLADELVRLRGDDVQAVALATGSDFPDALVVGSPGGREAIPTLLTGSDAVGPTTSTGAWMEANVERLRTVYIAGGPAVLQYGVDTSAEVISGR